MILKMWVKSKFVLWQPRYYNLLTEKKHKKIHDFDLKKFSSNNIFRWYTFGKFYIVKFNYFKVEDLIGRQRGDSGEKNIAGKYLKKMVSV